jgi:putative ABC transport system permease protein
MGMAGIYRGLVSEAMTILNDTGADLWVVQQGTNGPFAATSRIQEDLKYRLRALPGIAQASPVSYQNIQIERHGKPFRFFLVGYEPGGMGGPSSVVAGRPIEQRHYEMVADLSLGLPVGSQLELGRNDYTIVGLTRNMASSSGDPLVYVSLADAQEIQFKADNSALRTDRERVARGLAAVVQQQTLAPVVTNLAGGTHQINALVVRLEPSANPLLVQESIERWGHLRAISDSQQRSILFEGMIAKARKQIGLFSVILLIISAVIISLIIYTMTLDKLKVIATLKLIGAQNRVIVGLILQQSLIMGIVAYLAALVIINLTYQNFPRRVELLSSDLQALFLIVLCICVLASVAGIRKALSIEPAEALGG